MKNIKEQNYSSTYNFVTVNELEKEAVELFGKDWEAEDDVSQIDNLIKHLGLNFYTVEFQEGLKSDDDIKVELNEDLKRIADLEYALKELVSNVNLSKLNIRKDFSLINAHAHANKVLHNKN